MGAAWHWAAGGAALAALVDAALNRLDPAPPNLYWPDPRLGWTLAPGATREVTLKHKGETVIRNTIAINASGFNSRAFSTDKPAGLRRVMVIGDSMIESRHVPPDANLTSRCERALNAAGGSRWEVYNVGVAGWSADNALDFLRCEAETYKPDAVIFSLFLGNDLIEADYETFRYLFRYAWDCRRYDKPRWKYENGRLVVDNDPAWKNRVARLTSVRLYSLSWLYRKAYGAINHQLESLLNGNLKLRADGVSYNDFIERGKGRAHYHTLISDLVLLMQERCSRLGARFGVMILPNSNLPFPAPDEAAAPKKALEYRRDEAHYRDLLQALSSRCPTLGMLDALREAEKAGTALTQAPYDTHFNAAGHRLVGGALADFARKLHGL